MRWCEYTAAGRRRAVTMPLNRDGFVATTLRTGELSAVSTLLAVAELVLGVLASRRHHFLLQSKHARCCAKRFRPGSAGGPPALLSPRRRNTRARTDQAFRRTPFPPKDLFHFADAHFARGLFFIAKPAGRRRSQDEPPPSVVSVSELRDTIRQDRVFYARFPYVTRSRTRQPARPPALPGRSTNGSSLCGLRVGAPWPLWPNGIDALITFGFGVAELGSL
jgi:hypothetical protein